MSIEKKKVEDSRVETVHIVRPNHLNGANRLFGGILMQWIDEVAGLVAKRHAKTNVITASVDNLRFLKGGLSKLKLIVLIRKTYVCWNYFYGSAGGHLCRGCRRYPSSNQQSIFLYGGIG